MVDGRPRRRVQLAFDDLPDDVVRQGEEVVVGRVASSGESGHTASLSVSASAEIGLQKAGVRLQHYEKRECAQRDLPRWNPTLGETRFPDASIRVRLPSWPGGGLMRTVRFLLLAVLVAAVPGFPVAAAKPVDAEILRAAPLGPIVEAPDGRSDMELVRFDESVTARLQTLAPEETLRVDDWPVAPGRRAQVVLRRFDVYAPDAKIVVIEGGREIEVPRSRTIFFLGARIRREGPVCRGPRPGHGFVPGLPYGGRDRVRDPSPGRTDPGSTSSPRERPSTRRERPRFHGAAARKSCRSTWADWRYRPARRIRRKRPPSRRSHRRRGSPSSPSRPTTSS